MVVSKPKMKPRFTGSSALLGVTWRLPPPSFPYQVPGEDNQLG